jgi:hypothetical protein
MEVGTHPHSPIDDKHGCVSRKKDNSGYQNDATSKSVP